MATDEKESPKRHPVIAAARIFTLVVSILTFLIFLYTGYLAREAFDTEKVMTLSVSVLFGFFSFVCFMIYRYINKWWY